MKQKSNVMYTVSAIVALAFIIFTYLVMHYDRSDIGPMGSLVGFSRLNETFNNLTGYNEGLYNISSLLGIVTFAEVGVFAIVGLIQLIRGKSFKKVDAGLYVTLGLYVLLGAMYVLFEKWIINYRPVIMDPVEGLEASYPSSHTMLICTVVTAGIFEARRLIKNNTINTIIAICSAVIIAAMVGCRLCSGVHWLTDIIGGVLLGGTLATLFIATLFAVEAKENM